MDIAGENVQHLIELCIKPYYLCVGYDCSRRICYGIAM